MSAHTPGPWMVLPSVDRGQFCILTEYGNRIDIAVTYGFEVTPREANARLIAAAPDLLEALQRIANNFDESWVAGCVERQMGDIARAAILKATGEPS